MALVSPEGEFLLTNPALNEMLGYANAELLGATFQSLTHPDDLDADMVLASEPRQPPSTCSPESPIGPGRSIT